jgi:hypothetical protein
MLNGGATPITPQKGFVGTTTPGAISIAFFAGSKNSTLSREYGMSSRRVPRSPRKAIAAIGSHRSMERILISTVSPISAPRTSMGPSSVWSSRPAPGAPSKAA